MGEEEGRVEGGMERVEGVRATERGVGAMAGGKVEGWAAAKVGADMGVGERGGEEEGKGGADMGVVERGA